jgi:tetratricopeptide (TPR) repeat protein
MPRAAARALARRIVGPALSAIVLAPAMAQIPDEFTNLQVLPDDTSKRQLVSMMREFASALGVRCNHCHLGDDPVSLEGYDFASDEPEPKRVARAMMKMTREINGTSLTATGRRSPTRVRCVTCHRGVLEPQTLDRILLQAVRRESVEAAIRRYDELRTEYYGRGAYDFGPGTLNGVAEILAKDQQNVDAAIELMLHNVDLHPQAARSHLLLGQLYAERGESEAAVASIERALAIEPDNPWARRMLERVRAAE